MTSRYLQRQFKDPYVKAAKDANLRARAVFKLEEIAKKYQVFKPGQVVVDLGAAPGSFSAYAAQKVGDKGKVIAVDLLDFAPIKGVDFIKGDFTDDSVLATMKAMLAGKMVDVVMSDMAPNLTGDKATDQFRSIALAESALIFAQEHLAKDGKFLIKLFYGSEFDNYVAAVKAQFSAVKIIKPKASRKESREVYLLANR